MAYDPNNLEIYSGAKPELPPGHYSLNANQCDTAAVGPVPSMEEKIEAAEAAAREAIFAVDTKLSFSERTPEEIKRAEVLDSLALGLKTEANLALIKPKETV